MTAQNEYSGPAWARTLGAECMKWIFCATRNVLLALPCAEVTRRCDTKDALGAAPAQRAFPGAAGDPAPLVGCDAGLGSSWNVSGMGFVGWEKAASPAGCVWGLRALSSTPSTPSADLWATVGFLASHSLLSVRNDSSLSALQI